MSNNDKKHEYISSVAGTAGSTLLGTFAAALGLPLPEVAGLTVAGQLLGALAYDSIARRGETFLSTFRRELHEMHEDDFDAEVRKRSNDPDFKNVTYQALRQLRDALDDAVVPALAIMLKDYTVPEVKPIDPFFRDFTDLLKNLSAQEYGHLALLMDRVSSVYDKKSIYFTLAMSQQVPGKLTVGLSSRQGDPVTNVAIEAPVNTRLLLRLLDRHNLTGDRVFGNRPNTVGGVLGPSGPVDTGGNVDGVWRPGVNKDGIHWEVLAVLRFDVQQRLDSILKRAAVQSQT